MSLLAAGIVLLSTLMHAGWNLLAREDRATNIFLRTLLLTSLVGIGPAMAAEYLDTPLLPVVGGYLLLAGAFQALYYLGLSLGYRTGEFTVVYPLARALPVLLVALADLARGQVPSWLGWLGILLVSAGCTLIPLESLRGMSLARYLNRASGWILLTALSIVGYTLADAAAARVLPPGPWSALRYGLFELVLALVVYWMILLITRQPVNSAPRATWPRAAVVAALTFGAYTLVLWAYQLSAHTSYVVALRQLSIVIGVIAGTVFFREPAPGLRVTAAAMMMVGGVCIVMAR